MKTEIDTPRTDAMKVEYDRGWADVGGFEELCFGLERELAMVTRQRDELIKALEPFSFYACSGDPKCPERIARDLLSSLR